MPTNRVPIARMRKRSFTPEAIEAFKRLVEVFDTSECSCPPIDWQGEYWRERPRCASCSAYAKAEGELLALLDLRPWELLKNPHRASCFPPGSPAAEAAWKHPVNQAGRALWRKLEVASGVSPKEQPAEEEVKS